MDGMIVFMWLEEAMLRYIPYNYTNALLLTK
jgi:hypothetical protein